MLSKVFDAGVSKDNVYVFDTETESPDPELKSWRTLMQHGESDRVHLGEQSNYPATYNSTSGTSGLPKAAAIPHAYHVSQAEFLCKPTTYPVC